MDKIQLNRNDRGASYAMAESGVSSLLDKLWRFDQVPNVSQFTRALL